MGYKIVIFSNQNGIKGALEGKNATRFREAIDWLAGLVNAPIEVYASTKKDHCRKPQTGMWDHLQTKMKNMGNSINIPDSIYVGDAAGREGDHSAVDINFAKAIGIKFYVPEDYFDVHYCDTTKKRKTSEYCKDEIDNLGYPIRVLTSKNRAEHVSSAKYNVIAPTPRLVLLCGIPGAGKSTFASDIIVPLKDSVPAQDWVVLCQDRINKGKPGLRQKCEEKAQEYLSQGFSVIIDRTHVTIEQRGHFIRIGEEVFSLQNY